ncbi:MAG: HAD-IIA family hydrolase [Chloroflexi bacterium]|nr:MAG: haloacid dehalogenase [Phototrophicales bacterium]RMF77142.1 MAG: HAD-IIA family hydrolase [Chloroflexota bacterium]
MLKFADIAGVISDMDGVLWRGDEMLPGTPDLFAMLREREIPFVLATNNSAKTPAQYIDKLAGMGIHAIVESQIITSGTATVAYLQAQLGPGARVHVLGGDGLRHIIDEGGFLLVNEDADAVVVGIDTHLTYDKLKRATLLIRDGAEFIGTNPDVTFPAPEGLVPGAGSIIAAVQTATDRQPIIIGKPHRPMFKAALDLLGTSPETTVMLGDRLGTDIAGAQNAGLKSILLFTGVNTWQELPHSAVQPDLAYEDLPSLLKVWGDS